MDEVTLPVCPKCKSLIQESYNFCPNCSLNLQELRHVSWYKQIIVYCVSLFLPPFGLVYTIKYLKSPNSQVKWVGIIAMILTIIACIATVWLTLDVVKQIQEAEKKYSNMSNIGI